MNDINHKERIPRRAIRKARQHDKASTPRLDFLIGKSPAFNQLLDKVVKVAAAESTVLISGETGTGKGLLAKAIHKLSNRSQGAFLSVNCAALAESLVEAELFGYEQGAYTGAIKQKKGRFELAHQGTLFLDEIGEFPLPLQAKLLQVLEDKRFERVGGTKTIQSDVRIIAATNRNLQEMVQNGLFRTDLFYRLNVLNIASPPLRKRLEDIPLLVDYFIKYYSTQLGKNFLSIAQQSLLDLYGYDFPGNIRELKYIIERAMVLSAPPQLDLQVGLVLEEGPNRMESKAFPSLEEVNRQHIIKALQKTKGKIGGANSAAELLAINHKTLYSRIQKLGIDMDEIRRQSTAR